MYILNYTNNDYINIESSNMTSPYLNYIFYLSSSSSSSLLSKGTYFNLYNMIFNNISSSVIKWNTNNDLYLNTYLNMDVSSYIFITTALNVELNALIANSVTYIYFYNNIFNHLSNTDVYLNFILKKKEYLLCIILIIKPITNEELQSKPCDAKNLHSKKLFIY